MKIKLHSSVQGDLMDGFSFYDSQGKGLGDYFLDSIFSDIEIVASLRWNPFRPLGIP